MSWFSDSFRGNFDRMKYWTPPVIPPQAALPPPAAPPSVDNSAASRGRVSDIFASFSPDYYSGKQSAFVGQYLPMLTNYYDTEKSRLNAGLASRGVAGSSLDTNANASLDGLLANTQKQYDDTYSSWENGQRNAIDNARNDFLGQATANSDPNALGSAAQTRADSLRGATPSYSPVGNVFASVVNPLAGSSKQIGPASNALAFERSSAANLAGAKTKQSTGQVAVAGGPSSRVVG